MVRAAAGKKSRPSASRSNSTTASSAKGAKKTGASDPDEWSNHDQLSANAQGWGVFECVDEKTVRVFFEVFETDKRFENSNFARHFVAAQSQSNSALAAKAMRVVFRSKAGATSRKK